MPDGIHFYARIRRTFSSRSGSRERLLHSCVVFSSPAPFLPLVRSVWRFALEFPLGGLNGPACLRKSSSAIRLKPDCLFF